MKQHGPTWLGIGAQRAGTTWFTDLITQHPLVAYPLGMKEHNELYRYGLLQPWDDKARDKYRRTFTHPEMRLGEFTPMYMRALWMCEVARDVLPEQAPILVLLRDPVERFASALRHMMAHAVRRHNKRLERANAKIEEDDPPLVPLPKRPPDDAPGEQKRQSLLKRVAAAAAPRYVLGPPDGAGLQDRTWLRYVGSDGTWGGMYGAQLQAWTNVLPHDRFIVIQYEKLRQDPQHYTDLVWRRLGLDPVPLEGVDRRSASSTEADLWRLEDHPHLVQTLRAAYRPDTAWLADNFDIDLGLWKTTMSDG